MLIFSRKEGNMKLRLKDGREFAVLDGTVSKAIRMELDSLEGIEDARKALTKENLSLFQFTDDAGQVYGEYEHCVLYSVSYEETEEGKFLAEFRLRELPEMELRLDALEERQKAQDGAIEKLTDMLGGNDGI